MSEREFADGAFYWVRYEVLHSPPKAWSRYRSDWTVARFDRGAFRPFAWKAKPLPLHGVVENRRLVEVGECIGKEPRP